MEKVKIFISGTSEVSEEANQVYKYLEELGHEPLWYEENFYISNKNAMDECLENVKISDRLILILNKRYGLPYGDKGYSITETEFNLALEEEKDVLIFIKDNIWIQSPMYKKQKTSGILDKITDEKFHKEMGFKAEQNIYEFIDRIQHKVTKGKINVRWISDFNKSDQIIDQINKKWKLPYIKIKNLVSWDDNNFLDPLNESGYEPKFMRSGGVKKIDIDNQLVVEHAILTKLKNLFKKEIENPIDKVHFLLGKSGCGKSTLIRLLGDNFKDLFYYYEFLSDSEEDLNLLEKDISLLKNSLSATTPSLIVLDNINSLNSTKVLWQKILLPIVQDNSFNCRILLVSTELSIRHNIWKDEFTSSEYSLIDDILSQEHITLDIKSWSIATINYLKGFIRIYLEKDKNKEEQYVNSILENQYLLRMIYDKSNALDVILLKYVLTTIEWKERPYLLPEGFEVILREEILKRLGINKDLIGIEENYKRTIIFVISFTVRYDIPMPHVLLKEIVDADVLKPIKKDNQGNPITLLEDLINKGKLVIAKQIKALPITGYNFLHQREGFNYFNTIYEEFLYEPNIFNLKADILKVIESFDDLLNILEDKLQDFLINIGNLKGKRIITEYYSENGKWYYNQSNYKKSLVYYEKAIYFIKEIFNKDKKLDDQAKMSILLSDIGVLYDVWGKYNKALILFTEAIKIDKQLGNLKRNSINLNYLGGTYRKMREYDKALIQYEEALKINDQIGNLTAKAIILSNIGRLYSAWGKSGKALKQFAEALTISDQKGDLAMKAHFLFNIGMIYEAWGGYDIALTVFAESLMINKQFGFLLQASLCLNHLGMIYNAKQEYDKALIQYEEAIKISDQLGNLRTKATCLINLGNLYRVKGDDFRALLQYEKSLKINEQLGDLAGKVICLNNSGVIFSAMGDNEKALILYNEALKISEQLGDLTGKASYLSLIGMIYKAKGDYDKALISYNEALTINKQIGNLTGKATCLNNIGVIYNKRGDYNKALRQFKEVLKIDEQLGNLAGKASCIRNIGLIYIAKGDYNKALKQFEEALNILTFLGITESPEVQDLKHRIEYFKKKKK
ncbi:MAG: tetratricopeptide repeat protein [Promethearchaeota archaeon]